MNKLLLFFLPKAVKEISKLFGVVLVGALVIHLMPIDKDLKVFFVGCLLGIFPFIIYFNRAIYLPVSLDWILLTPIKKLHIILVHGLINIFKITFALLLIFIFYLIYSPGDFGPWYAEKNFVGAVSNMSAENFTYWIGFFGLLGIFVFGILPNYVQAVQDKKNYQVKISLKEKLKKLMVLSPLLLFASGVFSDDQDIEYYFADFIKIGCLLVFTLFFAIDSTLRSLRYYFPKNKLYIGGILLCVLFCSFLRSYASRDILSKNIDTSDKIESLLFLGAYSGELDQVIGKDLLASGPELAKLTSTSLKPLFNHDRKGIYLQLAENWQLSCAHRKDFTCRLLYYLQTIDPKKVVKLDLVISACPNDLRSCLIVFDHPEVPVDEQNRALAELTESCKDNKNEIEKIVCSSFESQMKYKKK